MRLTGTESALVIGSVLGVLIVLLYANREEGGSAIVDAPTLTEQKDVVDSPGIEGSSSTVSPSSDSDRLEESAAPNDSQVFASGNIGRTAAPAKGSQVPEVGVDATALQEEVRPKAIGVPFRPSSTIVERCRTRPAPTAESCEEVNRLIEEMSREERDEAWAKRTESRIRAVVAARQDGTQIRALECKTSLCAIETVSPASKFLSILLQAEQESAGVVDDGDFVLGWEQDPTHGRLTITVSVFGRRIQ